MTAPTVDELLDELGHAQAMLSRLARGGSVVDPTGPGITGAEDFQRKELLARMGLAREASDRAVAYFHRHGRTPPHFLSSVVPQQV